MKDLFQPREPSLEELQAFTDNLNAEGLITDAKRNAWNLAEANSLLNQKLADGERFGEQTVKDLHAVLSKDVKSPLTGARIQGGKYSIGIRTMENSPWQPKPTCPPELLPDEMKKLGSEIEGYMMFYPEDPVQAINVIKHAADILIKLFDIHPFQDGNGRLGRLIADGILKSGGLYAMPHWLEPQDGNILQRRTEYLLMVEIARQHGDFRLLYRFMAQQQIDVVKKEIKAIKASSQASLAAKETGYLQDRTKTRSALRNFVETLSEDLNTNPPKALPIRTTKGHPPVDLTPEEIKALLEKYSFIGEYLDTSLLPTQTLLVVNAERSIFSE
jgi:Fic family protein